MTDEDHPIAYTALRPGTPVQLRGGEPLGTVEEVLVVEEVAVFDGLLVRTDAGTRFVDADHVGEIYTSHVRTTLSAEEAAGLPVPEQKPAAGGGGLLGRLFGGGRRRR